MRLLIIGIIAIIFLLGGMIWGLINYFNNWDHVITHKQWFFIQWKPVLVIIVGNFIAIYFKALKAKRA